jgi:hypothetical protein
MIQALRGGFQKTYGKEGRNKDIMKRGRKMTRQNNSLRPCMTG